MTPHLTDLVARAKAFVDKMTPAERDAMFDGQRAAIRQSLRDYPERETACVVQGVGSLPGYPVGLYSAPAAPEPAYRGILISLCVGVLGSEHMGDAKEEVSRALDLAGINCPADIEDDEELRDWLETSQSAISLWERDAPGDHA